MKADLIKAIIIDYLQNTKNKQEYLEICESILGNDVLFDLVENKIRSIDDTNDIQWIFDCILKGDISFEITNENDNKNLSIKISEKTLYKKENLSFEQIENIMKLWVN